MAKEARDEVGADEKGEDEEDSDGAEGANAGGGGEKEEEEMVKRTFDAEGLGEAAVKAGKLKGAIAKPNEEEVERREEGGDL